MVLSIVCVESCNTKRLSAKTERALPHLCRTGHKTCHREVLELKQLLHILDRNTLLRLAGSRVYGRGEDYFILKKAKTLSPREGGVSATVRGTRDYSVSLWLEDGEIAFSCDCPQGEEDKFCKHCVAVGLKLLDTGGTGRKTTHSTTMDDVRAWLNRQKREALVDMLMGRAKNDSDLRKQLLMNAARENPSGIDFGTFRKAIDDATFVEHGYVDYRSSYEFAEGIWRVLSSIRKLLDDGHAAEVVELAEYALARVVSVWGMVDDSSGNIGSVMSDTQELHHDACLSAKPDVSALAGKLVEWELTIDGDAFDNAAAIYADVLGDEGATVYRDLVEAEWEKVPQINAGQDSSERWGRRYRLSRIMEGFARRYGGIEDRVAIMSRDLSTAHCYLQIAELYKEARNSDAALDWAEKGLAAFPKRTDWRLRVFLAEEYHARGRHDDAMALVWAQFSESPQLRQYQELKSHADKIGQWDEWREKALGKLRRDAADSKSRRPAGLYRLLSPDSSTLVEILVWEKEIELAWNEAQQGGCSDRLWMELAHRREEDHPEDSLRIYQAAIEPLIQQKNNQAYSEAVKLLARVNKVMAKLGRSNEFKVYLATVRAAHKPKRNFTKMIDDKQWLG